MEVILLGVLLSYPPTWSRLLLASLATLILLLAPFQPAQQPIPPPANQVPPSIVGEMAVSQIQAYVHSVAVSDLMDYLHDQDVRAAQEATQTSWEAAQTARVSVTAPQLPVTGQCGGATNGADQYIMRESGGDPTVVNPSSGSFGCYQIMGETWAGSCSDLGDEHSASPATQAACASRLPLSAWAL